MNELCQICGTNHSVHVDINGRRYCGHCFTHNAFVCDECGDINPVSSMVTDGSIDMCTACFEEYYIRCFDCDSITSYDDAVQHGSEWYCSSCADYLEIPEDSGLFGYGYKPTPVFHGEGRYLGVELEVDHGSWSSELQTDLGLLAGSDELYLKSDGSLDSGFEMVTHPMTLEWHKNQFPWETILDTVKGHGFRSHNTSTCGLHVHVDRKSLGNTVVEQEATINNLLYFIENNWTEIVKFSRRSVQKLDQWASRYGRPEVPTGLIEYAKGSNKRYACVNLCNLNTIEFRIFKGTLVLNTLLATLEFVDFLCTIAKRKTLAEMQDYSWISFVLDVEEKGEEGKELVEYLKSKRLFVNCE